MGINQQCITVPVTDQSQQDLPKSMKILENRHLFFLKDKKNSKKSNRRCPAKKGVGTFSTVPVINHFSFNEITDSGRGLSLYRRMVKIGLRSLGKFEPCSLMHLPKIGVMLFEVCFYILMFPPKVRILLFCIEP